VVEIDLNEVVQACVALIQPQANRERIIIRTSLAPHLPPPLARQKGAVAEGQDFVV